MRGFSRRKAAVTAVTVTRPDTKPFTGTSSTTCRPCLCFLRCFCATRRWLAMRRVMARCSAPVTLNCTSTHQVPARRLPMSSNRSTVTGNGTEMPPAPNCRADSRIGRTWTTPAPSHSNPPALIDHASMYRSSCSSRRVPGTSMVAPVFSSSTGADRAVASSPASSADVGAPPAAPPLAFTPAPRADADAPPAPRPAALPDAACSGTLVHQSRPRCGDGVSAWQHGPWGRFGSTREDSGCRGSTRAVQKGSSWSRAAPGWPSPPLSRRRRARARARCAALGLSRASRSSSE